MGRNKKHSKGRAWLTSIKPELCCEVCKEDAEECLEFHHIDPSLKDFTLSQAARKGYSVDKMKAEIEKCAVLCSNCHKKVHSGRIDLDKDVKKEIHQKNRDIIFRHS